MPDSAPKRKILATGVTGQTFVPVAEALARDNEVWCLGRFGDPEAKRLLEESGITTHVWNMGVDELHGVPDDFTHVLHAATLRGSDDPDEVVAVNAVGTAMLMTHCRKAEAFLGVSTMGVYRFLATDHPYAETDPVSGNTPSLPSYATTKLIQEGVMRAYSRTLGLPSVIARLNVGYGTAGRGGLPIRVYRSMHDGEAIPARRDGQDEWHNVIHTDDLARQVPLLWDVAAEVPPVVNWAGDDMVSMRQMVVYITEITGVEAAWEPREISFQPMGSDNTRRRELIGECDVKWRDGIRIAIEAHFPTAVG